MPLSVLSVLACLASSSFEADAQPPSELPTESVSPQPAKPWNSPLKDIEAGPGKLDVGLNVRTRYEYLDKFSILHYGTDTDDDVLLLDAFYAQRILSEPKDRNFDHWPYHLGAVYARVKQLPVTLDAFYVVKHDWSGNTGGENGMGNETRHTFGLCSERPAGSGRQLNKNCHAPRWCWCGRETAKRRSGSYSATPGNWSMSQPSSTLMLKPR